MMNIIKPFLGIFFFALSILSCGTNDSTSQENNQNIPTDTVVEIDSPVPEKIDPLILGIWKLNNSAINGQLMNFQTETSGLKTWTFYEDGTFEEHQVIDNEMVVGNGNFKTTEKKSLVTSIETNEEPLVVNYIIELLSADSLVIKGTEENEAFTFFYVKAE